MIIYLGQWTKRTKDFKDKDNEDTKDSEDKGHLWCRLKSFIPSVLGVLIVLVFRKTPG